MLLSSATPSPFVGASSMGSMENAVPGATPARKVGQKLAGRPQPSSSATQCAGGGAGGSLVSPALGKARSRPVLGDISNRKAPRDATSGAAPAKIAFDPAGALGQLSFAASCSSSSCSEAAPPAAEASAALAMAVAAPCLGDDLPPVEKMSRRHEPSGAMSLDATGFDVEGAIDALCAQHGPVFSFGTPLEKRARSQRRGSLPGNAPSVFAELQTPCAATNAAPLQLLHQQSTNFFAGAQTSSKCPGAPMGGRAGGVVFGVPVVSAAACSAARDAELEKELDLSKLELVPPTPVRSVSDSSNSEADSDMDDA